MIQLIRIAIAGLLVGLPLTVPAQQLFLNDLKSQGGVQLTADELKQLMPGAKVMSRYRESTRQWTNEPDGKFVASTTARAHDIGRTRAATAPGTWHVGDNGTYCVTVEWKTINENWCRYIFKVGDKYYGVRSIADGGAEAHEFAFSK
jgi:hypothetical protein